MGAPGPAKAAASRKHDGERVCCERTGRTARRTSCGPSECWAKRSRNVVTQVCCCNRSDLPLGGHASPGGREYGGSLARVDTLRRIFGGPSEVNRRETRNSAGRDFPYLRQWSCSLLERGSTDRPAEISRIGTGQSTSAAASIATSRS